MRSRFAAVSTSLPWHLWGLAWGVLGVVGLGLGLVTALLADHGQVTLSRYQPPYTFPVGLMVSLPAVRLLFRHSFRATGLVPLAALAWIGLAGICWALSWEPGLLLGITFGTILLTTCRYLVDFRPSGEFWVLVTALGIPLCLLPLPLAVMLTDGLLPHPTILMAGLILTGMLTFVLGLAAFRRPLVEMVTSTWAIGKYRLRATGPGLEQFPRTGPVLVIANHACYLDPVFLGKMLPRPVTPMMTARFFDKPFIRQLMKYVFDTIRVTEDPVKRDASELKSAIAALAHGRNLLIFPEGYLRRKEEVPLRRFGRGVWEILRAHPDTPVVACWIEGSWGSYFSFADGPPCQNKPPDRRRPIDIAVSMPEVVPAEVLEHHLKTRLYLMEKVNQARVHIGLEPIDLQIISPAVSTSSGHADHHQAES